VTVCSASAQVRHPLNLVLAASFALAFVGCYQAHERAADAGSRSVDGGRFASRCGSSLRGGCNGTWDSEARGEFIEGGTPIEVCTCLFVTCSRTSIPPPCRVRYEGDSRDFECAMFVPADPLGGVCLRPCTTADDCPTSMRCVPTTTLGLHVDVERACADVVSR
jgi:hypothetical protein